MKFPTVLAIVVMLVAGGFSVVGLAMFADKPARSAMVFYEAAAGDLGVEYELAERTRLLNALRHESARLSIPAPAIIRARPAPAAQPRRQPVQTGIDRTGIWSPARENARKEWRNWADDEIRKRAASE